MNVLLILGGRGLRSTWVDQVLTELGTAADQVHLTLVTWHRPSEPIPVEAHWVVGPQARSGVRAHPVLAVDHPAVQAPSEGFADESARPATDEQGSAPVPAVDGTPDASLSPVAEPPEAGREQRHTTDGPQEVSLSAGRATLPPLYHPARLRAAAAWRLRRLRRAARDARRRVTRGSSLAGRAAARYRRLPAVRRAQADRAATAFALAVTRDARIREAVARSTVVVAVDGNAHRAAWLLSRRVPGPEVVAGLPAARRVVQSQRR